MRPMKRCQACTRSVALAEVHCRHCGAAIDPPPPRWLAALPNVVLAASAFILPFQVYGMAMRFPRGRELVAAATDGLRFLWYNGSQLGALLLVAVVAPALSLYWALMAFTDLSDWFDRRVQKHREARFRKYGW